ncbi:alanine--tRNA ligase [Dethiothermospora halolimnae]|uniref:alanine--tRNA ligase n=1 Tax=Dethiothermospora halolimnae TaxID=3114390 RepID=UPI003CCBF938
MKKLGLHEIRKEFLDFFKEKDHLVAPSYSLVPANDKSLLLINAGMAPLKPYFIGTETPPKDRMSTCQKCVRTGDIENVGVTSRHGTFFEMLGNFSFGDYFKEEAIAWAWEFMTERLDIPEDKLWVTVYKDDDEAYNIWKDNIKINKDRIVRLGKEDNFWGLEVGPCGPCSEIYIDRGEKYGCEKEDCLPGCDDCERYVEVWNLVFSQYDKDKEGNYSPLPKPNIDTGMGLERIATVLQGTENIFEIEPIKSILEEVESISGKEYKNNDKDDMSIRVITDHVRATTFLVSDGVIPSNEGRGYVLRRLIRRAARHGKLLGVKGHFLNKLSEKVIELWKEVYPEIEERKKQIKKVIKVEEEKFQETIDQGINILDEYIEDMKKNDSKVLSGVKAFKLYDTYGFPLDLTKEIIKEQQLDVNEEEFNNEMEKQRQRARRARQEGDNSAWNKDSILDIHINEKVEFRGYNTLEVNSKVLTIIKNDNKVDEIYEGDEGIVILDKTPFYGESGGQVGDTGTINNESFKGEVLDTKKTGNNIILHFIKVLEGSIKIGEKVNAIVNDNKRMAIARNHSATHLIHKALKEIVGEHVNQAGSLVLPDKLRFDFTHFEGLTKDEIKKVEKRVNDMILLGLKVETIETNIDEAKKIGATALFDEKYGDNVRVVKIGDYSKELCGGTHVPNSSNIGLFKIVSESGIASGVRRIEAITGGEVYKHMLNMEKQIENISDTLKSNKKDVVDKVKSLSDDNKKLQKDIEKLKSKLASSKLDDIIKEKYVVEGVNVISKKVDGIDVNGLRQLGDKLKDAMDSVLIVLGTQNGNKVNFVTMATKDLVTKGIHAGNIIREVAKITGGGGGGRPDMAQAGGKDPSKIEEALSKVDGLIKSQIK